VERLIPRFKWGNIEPPGGGGRRARRGPGYQFYRIVLLDVMEISVGLGIRDYRPEDVEDAIQGFWGCVDILAQERVDRIVLAGAPVSIQLGRDRVCGLLSEMEQKTGIPGDAPLEAVIAAMQRLGLERIAVASRWPEEVNARLAEYLRAGGLEVVGITSRGQWLAQATAMSFEDGLEVALATGREAARLAPDAEAVWVAGGAAMALHVIPMIEAEFGKVTMTNLTAEVWNGLVRPGVIPPVRDWGRLLATP
jgi:maleate cis-trans isomerase